MQLYDAAGRRLYFTEDERSAFAAAAARAPREVRTFCSTLHATGCRISEALALTADRVDLAGRVVVFESLKKRRAGVYRAVPVPPELLDALDLYDRAKANLPNLLVIITGKGPLRAAFEAEADKRMKSWPRVRMRTAWIERADYPRLLGA